jgi:hypothetical protein
VSVDQNIARIFSATDLGLGSVVELHNKSSIGSTLFSAMTHFVADSVLHNISTLLGLGFVPSTENSFCSMPRQVKFVGRPMMPLVISVLLF